MVFISLLIKKKMNFANENEAPSVPQPPGTCGAGEAGESPTDPAFSAGVVYLAG